MPLDADGSDPPTEESADILAQLSELGVRPEDVEVVICTHFDIDHVGHPERAVSLERQFSVDRQPRSYEDVDRLRASTRKLLDLVSCEKVALTVFHHDSEQWRKLRRAPEAYE